MYNEKQYNDFVENNSLLTLCQKNEFLNAKSRKDVFYLDVKSNKQIITYIDNAKKSDDFAKEVRIYELFNYFLKYAAVELLLNGIKTKKYPDDKVYSYVTKRSEDYQTKAKKIKEYVCSQYTFTFEQISLIIYDAYFKGPSTHIKYLDVSCGDGHKTALFAKKLNLPKNNVWGTDIEKWGPYKSKENMPINFKPLLNNKLNFETNEFDILSIFLSLHHIPIADVHALLDEFSRVLKPNGLLVIIEHNIVDDYDHLLVDIQHSVYSYIYDKKVNDTYANYLNYMEWDFICSEHDFLFTHRQPMANGIDFKIRYDNLYFALYLNKKN
jgi:ubiquinone/menaquinone biosynthesis C-methylase UbiE